MIEKMIQCHCCISRGSSGEEVVLSERRLQEKDIEEPLASQADDLPDSAQHPGAANSDVEEEQEFVSSVVTQGRRRKTVHWDDRKHRDKPEPGSERSEEVQRVEATPAEEEIAPNSHLCQSEVKADVNNQRLSSNTVDANGHQTSEDVEKAAQNLQLCSLSDAAPRPVDSTSALDGNPDSQQATSADLNISQVGLSKRGAAALRNLLSCHDAVAEADTIRQKLLAGLRRTFEEWCTAATQQFLYGSSRSLAGPPPKVSQDGQEGEEKLDEDDLADDVTDADGQGASANDYEKLREEVQQQEQRVRGFFKGTLSSPERVEDTSEEKVNS